jgi:hypothetical protein
MGGVVDFAKKAGSAALPFLGPVGGAVGAISGLLGRGGGGGGGGGGGSGDLRQSGGSAMDPATQARQLHLWNQAQQYAATNPFSRQYGDATAMPGMGAMSQAGQKYMTDAILGPGQYQSQNLGFTGYQRPQQPDFTYQPDFGAAQTRTAVPSATTTSPWIPTATTGDPGDPDEYAEADAYNTRSSLGKSGRAIKD